MMALSNGRAFEWARHHFGEHQFYVRTRMDDAFWCLPPVASLPSGPFIVADGVGPVRAKDGTPVRVFSDRYAVLPASLAHAYFDAWRIWSSLDCSHACYAGAGNTSWGASLAMKAWLPPGVTPPYRWSPWSHVGECAVTTWAEAFVTTQGVALFHANGAGNGIFRQHNVSHAEFRGRKVTFAELQQANDASHRSHVDTEACQLIPVVEKPLPAGLVTRPLHKVEEVLTCTGQGLCQAVGRTIEGSALLQWTLLFVITALVACMRLRQL